ncbi:MAG: peptidoglycan DD-metalloendopeptidase family protein [Bacteroidetes bacterium]|nr:peptidoglycan DD-metalloendopeptidase family protein [Bacteroidota bacterium]MBS1649832.1 peptidoglycan DD-metalloendopeptidase family protein [Bacteroidota bacterium]
MNKILNLFFIGLLFPFVMLAQQQPTKDDLQKQKKQLEQEIKELNDLQASISKNKKLSLKQLAIVQTKIRKREQLISSINKDIRRVEDQLYSNEVEINHLKKELDTLKQNYAKSIVFAYKNRGSYEYLNFLFSAQNFNDAFKRLTYLKSYRQYRETQAETILKTQNLLEQATSTLSNTKIEKTQVLKNQNEQLAALETDKKENARVVQDLKDQEKEVQAQLRKREKQRQELNRALAAAIRREIDEANRKEKERLAKLKADAAKNKSTAVAPTTKPSTETSNKTTSNKNAIETTGGLVKSGGKENGDYTTFESTPEGATLSLNFENSRGRLPWPVNGGIITHDFGVKQISSQLREKNDGVFIAVPVGTGVKCVADGEVATIINLDDDQAVMVKHGKYFTVYNKLASVNVSEGQKVHAGTVIGKAAVSLDGNGGEIEFRIMNLSNQFLNPHSWLKPL